MPRNFYNHAALRLSFAALLFFLAPQILNAANLRLSWNASADPNVAGYNLSYGTTPGRYTKSVNAGPSTSTSVSLTPGFTYYFVVSAYNSIGLQSSPSNEVALAVSNQPPAVSLTSPQANSNFGAHKAIGLSANASDPDGTIAKVEFYRDTNKIGESTSAPYSATWNNVPSGSYTLTALAFDDSGAAVRSSGVPITVSGASPGASPTPNSGKKVRVIAMTPFVQEGAIARFKVVTTEVSQTDTEVNYSLGGNAAGGVNYAMNKMTGHVKIPSGKRSVLMGMQTLKVPGHTANRTVTVSVAPGNGYTPGRGAAVVRIIGR